MSFDPRTPMAQQHDAHRARQRRDRALAISLSVLVVVGLVGFGSYMVLEKSEASEQKQAAPADDAKAPSAERKKPADGSIEGLRTWDATKLTRNHVAGTVTYPMKPPVGGDHNPVWMNCDGEVYEKALPDVNAVHSLEHGSVWVTYTDKAPDADVAKLADRVGRTPYSLMSPYEGQSGTIMLSAWGNQVTVDGADDPRVDQFFSKFVQGPQTPEPGATCTGGLGAQ
ncbi:DUF3105 domain-containing protein [Streptomyces sp. NBC_01591]|uniref:DUF3105 domain-containing protein n=1 Tax=Streptomyces sp. NBC_01591 TaxID=2975888 RepID=UPI002DD94689|nr:DUF3105 domain-containing protein [Streptomyces sp. NBC_01591]WSD68094.1 DUF3105 domain-containing protein [Streptomyces sp. NBC_01591]